LSRFELNDERFLLLLDDFLPEGGDGGVLVLFKLLKFLSVFGVPDLQLQLGLRGEAQLKDWGAKWQSIKLRLASHGLEGGQLTYALRLLLIRPHRVQRMSHRRIDLVLFVLAVDRLKNRKLFI